MSKVMPWYDVMILWVICSFCFGPCVILLKWFCDIKSFKISTAYDVWFSRYRPSNLMLATDTDSAQVLMFINVLWVVYFKYFYCVSGNFPYHPMISISVKASACWGIHIVQTLNCMFFQITSWPVVEHKGEICGILMFLFDNHSLFHDVTITGQATNTHASHHWSLP